MSSPLPFLSRYSFRCSTQRLHTWRNFSGTVALRTATAFKSQDTQTYYDLFPKSLPKGPPPEGSFCVDSRALRREFIQLQSIAHPDRHSADLKAHAQAESAQINEAYKVLLDPLLRAQYLLSLHLIDVTQEGLSETSHELLAEVMELQEAVEGADNMQLLREIHKTTQNRIQHSVELLEKYFSCNDLQAAKFEVIKLKYWMRIKESIEFQTNS